ncbi:unnamed protein product [Larinioides sclopetarius]|uniref:Uncharacterized protein n=1 Tax=Larinioides sclopetarius TaxID=280406 RepID=A0AAV2BLA5_9ARAC
MKENEGSQSKFSIYCLTIALVDECGLRAINENCGDLAAEAGLEVLRLSKTLENACSARGAKSVLDELDNMDLNEDKKRSITQLLGKLVE